MNERVVGVGRANARLGPRLRSEFGARSGIMRLCSGTSLQDVPLPATGMALLPQRMSVLGCHNRSDQAVRVAVDRLFGESRNNVTYKIPETGCYSSISVEDAG